MNSDLKIIKKSLSADMDTSVGRKLTSHKQDDMRSTESVNIPTSAGNQAFLQPGLPPKVTVNTSAVSLGSTSSPLSPSLFDISASNPGFGADSFDQYITRKLEGVIRNHPLFGGSLTVSETFIADITKVMHVKPYRTGDVVVKEGEPAKAMFFIIKGEVQIVSEDGEFVVAEMKEGGFFGEIGILFDANRTATAVCKTKCVLAVLKREQFQTVLTRHPAIASIIVKEAQTRYQALKSKLENMGKEIKTKIQFIHVINSPVLEDSVSFPESIQSVSEISDPTLGVSYAQAFSERGSRNQLNLIADDKGSRYQLNELDGNADKGSRNELFSTPLGSSEFDMSISMESVNLTNAKESVGIATEKNAWSNVEQVEEVAKLELNIQSKEDEHEQGPQRQGISYESTKTDEEDEDEAMAEDSESEESDDVEDEAEMEAKLRAIQDRFSGAQQSSHTTFKLPGDQQEEMVAEGDGDSIIANASGWNDNASSKSGGSLVSSINSHIGQLVAQNTGRRRASVAVWSDDKLMQMASNITSRSRSSSVAPTYITKQSSLANSVMVPYSNSDESLDGERTLTLADLDEAIMEKILQYVGLRKAYSLRRLSKRFMRIVASSKLIQNLDLSPYNKSLKDDMMISLVSYCGTNIDHLNLKGCWFLADRALQAIAQYAPSLQTLNLSDCWDITDNGLTTVGKYLSNLYVLELSNCRKITDVGVISVVSQCRNLQELALSYCKNLTGAIFGNMDNWKRMRKLNLQRCTGIFDDGFAKWSGHELAFTELILADCSFLSNASVINIAKSCKRLHILSLSFCCALTEQSIQSIVDECQEMRALDLSFCGSAVTDAAVQQLAKQLIKLQRLSVRGCIQLGDTGASSLLELPRLQLLNVTNCKAITGEMQQHLKQRFTLLDTQSVIQEASLAHTHDDVLKRRRTVK